MAHNLATNSKTGKAAMFSAQELPWHRLGEVVDNAQTSAEAISLAGLDFQVIKTPLTTQIGKKTISVPEKFATVRTDTNTALGVVGNQYTPLQNTEAFTFFDNIVGEGQAIFHTAGALGDGSKVWILAKMPDYIKVAGDAIEKYLLLSNSHDGTGAVQVMFTPIRVVCQNTLMGALKETKNKVSIRHTVNVRENLQEAQKVLKITNAISSQMGQIFGQMAKAPITDKAFKKYVETIFAGTENEFGEKSTRIQNIHNSIYEYAELGPGQQHKSAKGTVYGAYNAITGYFQNVANYKDDEAKAVSLNFGTGAKTMQHAFTLAMDLAGIKN